MMNHLWQSTLVVFAVWLAALALRRNAARVRCWLWTAASTKFLVPLSLLVSLGESLQWRAAPQVVQPAVQFVMRDVLAPVAPLTPGVRIAPRSRRVSRKRRFPPRGTADSRRLVRSTR